MSQGEKAGHYRRILEAFYRTPLAITEEKLFEIAQFLRLKAAGQDVSEESIQAIASSRRREDVQIVGRVGIISIFGVISQRVGLVGAASGGVSTEAIGAALDDLASDRQIRSIVLAFDSPGGSVYGVSELAEKINGYRGQKKIVGIADSVAASAAYWLLSQTQEINVTPGGQVGSIGVLAAHEDLSGLYEKLGSKTTLISAGKYKSEANPYGPLTAEAKAELQSKVDSYYAMFVSAVARGRGVREGKVKSDFGQGRMVLAKEAVAQGMADKVATIAQVLRRLGAENVQGGAVAISPGMAMARARSVEIEQAEGRRRVSRDAVAARARVVQIQSEA